jgi:hypothetical protein
VLSSGYIFGLIRSGTILGQIEKVLAKKDENPVTPPAPTTLPALPAANDTIRVTRGGVGEDIPRKLLHEFDERDLAFLFRALARGEKFTEANMELWELPYSHQIMGKAQEGTPYSKFTALCVRAEIIGGRGPKQSGTLLVTEAGEMMQRIKALQETPTP